LLYHEALRQSLGFTSGAWQCIANYILGPGQSLTANSFLGALIFGSLLVLLENAVAFRSLFFRVV